MSWHFVERWLQKVGCPNICFNKFSPISHIRFWSFQIIMVTTPSIVFMVYSAHQIKKKPPSKEKLSITIPSPIANKKSELMKEGILGDEEKKKWKKSQLLRQGSLDMIQEMVEPRKTVIQEMFGEDKAAFSQHYILYGLSVVMRTGVEVVFIYLQYQMFGFQVTELYKCFGKPCPNVVDCFVSRPMEKTIFLWFMFIIAILCFFLNVIELLYLFWQFCVRRPHLERARRKMIKRSNLSENQAVNLGNAEILDGGVLSGCRTATAPPEYRGDVADLFEMENIDLDQLINAPGNAIAMPFNMNDAIFPENFHPPSKCYNYPIEATSLSSTSKNFTVHPTNEVSTDQPYLANPRTENSKQKEHYDYV